MKTRLQPLLLALLLVAVNVAIRQLTLPDPAVVKDAPFHLVPNPDIVTRYHAIAAENPLLLLLPNEYETGRVTWPAALLPPYIWLYDHLSPWWCYMLLSSGFVLTGYFFLRQALRDELAAALFGLLLALGTQFHYVHTYGNTTILFILLGYVMFALFAVSRFFEKRDATRSGFRMLVMSFILLALIGEMWMNVAAVVLACSALAAFFHRKRDPVTAKKAAVLFSVCASLVVLWVSVRLFSAKFFHFVHHGAEEEFWLTYPSVLLMVDDVVNNFFTMLYMVLGNYLPSFPFSSASLTYLGEQPILDGQNGYHPDKVQLVAMSHVFLWRFMAGGLVFTFVAFTWRQFRRATSDLGPRHWLLFSLCAGSVLCHSVYLFVKARPYNSMPILSYKVSISLLFFSILLAVVSADFVRRINSRVWRVVAVASFFLIILCAAFTRPAMLNRGMRMAGLEGYGDPAEKVVKALHKPEKPKKIKKKKPKPAAEAATSLPAN